jgi:eukaryotic-like serine/threonine-protein kinase
MSDETESPVPIGTIIAGKYRVEQVLGAGGIGVVVRASHLHLHDNVVLKFLLPTMARHPEMVARFLREAQAARRITGEHVGRVEDVGTLPSGEPYMVMEYLAGSDLSQVLERGGALPVPMAVAYVLEACEAIAQAHAVGIVHRDLKPANLFLANSPGGRKVVKVLDFGISKMTEEGGVALTSDDASMGSPLYMPPEQIRSARDVDGRADIWSLGVILHELVTGDSPFMRTTRAAVFAGVIADAPPPLRQALPGAPAQLEAVILRCLEKEPARRYQSVGELARALSPLVDSRAAFSSIDRISNILPAAPVQLIPARPSGDAPVPQGNQSAEASSFAPVSSTLPGPRPAAAPATATSATQPPPTSNFGAKIDTWKDAPADPASTGAPPLPLQRPPWGLVGLGSIVLIGAGAAYLFYPAPQAPSSLASPSGAPSVAVPVLSVSAPVVPPVAATAHPADTPPPASAAASAAPPAGSGSGGPRAKPAPVTRPGKAAPTANPTPAGATASGSPTGMYK